MFKKVFIKHPFLPLWFGFLVFPFTGIKDALFLGLAIFTGEVIFFGFSKFEALSRIKEALKSILRIPFSPSFGKGRVNVVLSKGHNILFANIGLIAILTILPLFLNNYYIDVLTLAGLYAVLALGLNISVGLAGLLDLGYIAFYAIGAYTYALLSTKFGISFWFALPLRGFFAPIIGFMLGIITLRL